ncbi:MAG TPA: SDR family NAD(P)-dependent oxidoreductase [Hyphomonas sp.]|nr:SDR family NAD(P)-dependent oxidoreductase [Hyphomonas sp.]HRX74525.1 SDR family NAD(P)-dependent oxidoreductase [Hyphomonas sp.]
MGGDRSVGTVLVVGASTGFGAAIAEAFAARGDRVIGTSRSAPKDGPVAETGLTMARLDVCDDASVVALAARLEAAGIVPDLIVLNAGYGISGAVEDTDVAAAMAQFNTNFFGVHRMVRAVLPGMRARGSGRLIVVGSVAGRIAIPFQAFYSASKAAVASYVDALRMETAAFGIDVVLVEPGDHNTAFGAARPPSESGPDSVYQPQAQRAVAIMEASEHAGAPATDMARRVLAIAAMRCPKGRYLQANAVEKMGLFLQPVLPAAWFERVIMDMYKVPGRGR